jgi:hypothetical protein
VSVDAEALTEPLRSGQNRRDVDGTSIPELGFSAGLWNGDFKRAGAFSVKCGAWSPVVPNSFVLNLPAADDGAAELYQPETAKALMRAVTGSWEPRLGDLDERCPARGSTGCAGRSGTRVGDLSVVRARRTGSGFTSGVSKLSRQAAVCSSLSVGRRPRSRSLCC